MSHEGTWIIKSVITIALMFAIWNALLVAYAHTLEGRIRALEDHAVQVP